MRKLNITRAERTAWAMSDFMAPVYAVAMTGEIDATPLESLRLEAKSTVGAAPSLNITAARLGSTPPQRRAPTPFSPPGRGGPASRLFSEYQMLLGEADKIFENEFPVSQDPA